MTQLIIVILLTRIIIQTIPYWKTVIDKKEWFPKSNRVKNSVGLFDDHFIEPRRLYLQEFNKLPSVIFIGDVDAAAASRLLESGKYGKVMATYERTWYNWDKGRTESLKKIFKLESKMMVRVGEDWAEILYDPEKSEKAEEMLNEFKVHKANDKEDDYEINIISISNGSLDLKPLRIKPTDLDINLYYNDDFKPIDATIKERLKKDNDKGIVLLHGLPGTGKTTYLRHLIGSLKKKVLFVSPAVAGNLMNPEFMDLLIDNANAVLVIEDAANIIMDRKYSSQSSVSNLLNISDGLLSDCLNVQIICTFNSSLNMVDSALLRKGRLIAKYEFGKLATSKARALSNHLGLKQVINQPMTLAEITNPEEISYQPPTTNVIGFRREFLEN